jgi:hypothetical protein
MSVRYYLLVIYEVSLQIWMIELEDYASVFELYALLVINLWMRRTNMLSSFTEVLLLERQVALVFTSPASMVTRVLAIYGVLDLIQIGRKTFWPL